MFKKTEKKIEVDLEEKKEFLKKENLEKKEESLEQEGWKQEERVSQQEYIYNNECSLNEMKKMEQEIVTKTKIIPIKKINISPNVKIKSVLHSLHSLYDWNDCLTILQFHTNSRNILKLIQQEQNIGDMWITSVKQSLKQMNEQIPHLNYIFEGRNDVESSDMLLMELFKEDLNNLQPIKEFSKQKNEQVSFSMHVIQKNIEEGMKISQEKLDLIQKEISNYSELQNSDSKIALVSETGDEQELHIEIESLKNRSQQSITLILKAIDMLDLIKTAAQKDEKNAVWVEQIEKSISDYIEELKALNIEEIKAMGELLDGNIMISIGTLPQEAAPDFEKFQVCFVHERGFKNTSTGKVIREAKVINVY